MKKPANQLCRTGILTCIVIFLGLSSFSQTTVHLQWAALSDQDVDYFIIERGVDSASLNYRNLVKVRAGANPKATYRASDDISLLTSPMVYYRLKTITTKAKVSYSPVVAISLDNEKQVAMIIPGDVADQLKATITSKSKNKVNRKSVARIGK